jgi:hypothetical protein
MAHISRKLVPAREYTADGRKRMPEPAIDPMASGNPCHRVRPVAEAGLERSCVVVIITPNTSSHDCGTRSIELLLSAATFTHF